MTLSVWLVVVAQAQLYIFRCVHVSQLPQFKSVASDTLPEKNQVLVFELRYISPSGFLDPEYIQPPTPLSLSSFYSTEGEHSSDTLKPNILPQWLLHPGFEPPLQFTSFPAGWQKFLWEWEKFRASFLMDQQN